MIDQIYVDRFWGYVNKLGPDDCWEWKSAITKAGYGLLSVNGVRIYAHRISAELHGLDIKEKHVCHKCDNPPCVNPNHLFVGTAKDNMCDAANKGRAVPPPILFGEQNGCSKLTDEAVREIRSSTEPSRKLGKKFGVSKTNILRVRHGVIWGHVR